MRSKAGENNGLIRPPAESVPDLNNREIAPISLLWDWGWNSNSSGFPAWSELVGLIPCSAYVTENAPSDDVIQLWGRTGWTGAQGLRVGVG